MFVVENESIRGIGFWSQVLGFFFIFSGPCDVNPCQNDGTCVVDGENFMCQCVNGFSGMTCEIGTFTSSY